MTRERLILGALLAAAILLPAVVRSPYVLHVGVLAGIYVVLTLSLNLVTGFCGQFSLGHAGFYGIGAYSAALLAVTWGSPFVANLAGAAVAAGAAGFLIGLPTLRLGGIYLAMATLGFGEIIHLVLLNWLAVTRGPLGIPAIPGPAVLGVDLATPARQYYVVLALVVIATLIVSRLVNSSFGEAIQAIREDEIAAEALGVPTTRLKVVTFTLSAALAGVAGAFFAHYATFVSPGSFTLVESILVLSLLVFGGMGSVEGSIAGAVVLTVAPEVFRFLAEYRMVIYGAILLGLILFRPQGLLGGFSLGLTRRPPAPPGRRPTDDNRPVSAGGVGFAQ
jgi:branched-chain amino acid transport system permease protein